MTNRNTKHTLLAAAVSAALCLSAGSALAAKAGTYTATAQGHNGPVTVTMTVDAAGKIAALKVGANKETVGIADSALRIIPELKVFRDDSLDYVEHIDALLKGTSGPSDKED